MTGTTPILTMKGITKRYGGVVALREADLEIMPGRIHAVLGENGAGKSTLIKIMSGAVTPDEGTHDAGRQGVSFASPAAANAAGIVCVFQELSLIPDLSVADNIVISSPPTRGRPDRPKGTAPHRRTGFGRSRRDGHSPFGTGEGLAAVPPPDCGNRQGPCPPPARSHSRRSNLGPHRRRCAAGVLA